MFGDDIVKQRTPEELGIYVENARKAARQLDSLSRNGQGKICDKEHENALTQAIDALREGAQKGGKGHICNRFCNHASGAADVGADGTGSLPEFTPASRLIVTNDQKLTVKEKIIRNATMTFEP